MRCFCAFLPRIKREFAAEKLQLVSKYNKFIKVLESKIQDHQNESKQFKNFVEAEIQVHIVIKERLTIEVNKFKKATHKMRSILRVPRLCKDFHDLLADPMVSDQFKAIDEVYEKHFASMAD